MSLFKKQSIQENISHKENIPKKNEAKIPQDLLLEISSLKNTNDDITTSIGRISNSVNTLSEATVRQSEEINSTTNILRDFNENMESLAYNITNVQDKIIDTEEASTEGLDNIEKLDNSLNDLKSAFSISSSTVNDLVEKLESVNSITDSINKIAVQTNLLSLNAAIEAARAGEAGRGFSVVAGEVRKLAENSKQAVQSISNILNDIKEDILKASNAMTSGNEAINIQQNSLVETKYSFLNIKNSIVAVTNEINDCIENLAMASSQKDSAIESVEKANSISHEYTALTQEIAASMEVQNSSVDNFNKTLSSLVTKLSE
ncbi:Methyl-accepting chemotaxis protein (MCP) signalling domain-containing protein [Clostridium sp. DSM 8431]|uniref:methyl-accepting chemotaxis protein n=1 Tax=Clostridium sp. DSM 8431 TaxID=1761781 RepID=UPI0008E202F2|nr:methyl-accepting chemotaxis protein [Clostridium sp. DSM 8431]SFU83314.1 Methyl-accepting chemotaxis protein (MCP) signalling domain-containing protein [Clostridium sp. DSM 8431]